MAKLQLTWDLSIEGFSERGEDEVSIQFALVTTFGGVVRLDPYVTGNLFPSVPFGEGLILPPGSTDNDGRRIRAQGIFSVPANVPTTANPYLGFVARAVELDSSTDDNRTADNERFFTAIQEAAQEAEGGMPTTDDLWSAGNGAAITDRGWWLFDPDDDARVSTSVRVFPEFGSRLQEALAAESAAGTGGRTLPGPSESFNITFVGSNSDTAGALYQVEVSLNLVTNGGPASSQSWY
jgi:hypothetical protein